MKKFVYFFVSALFMVSCNQEEVLVETPEENAEVPRAIGFETFVDKSSRAEGTNSTALNDYYPTFLVNGWKEVGGKTTQVFENMAVNFVGNDKVYAEDYAAEWGATYAPGWYYHDLRYWDKMASAYQFCAYAPVEAKDVVECSQNGQIIIGTPDKPVKVETTNLKAEPAKELSFTGFAYDYMIATSSKTLDKVSLNFKHLQAKMNICLHLNESVTTAQPVTVTKVIVHNLGNKGHYNNHTTEALAVSGWLLAAGDADYTLQVIKDYVLNGASNYNGHYVLEQLVLPQTIQKAASAAPSLAEFTEACIYVEYTIGNEVFKSYTPLANLFTTSGTYKFEGGKQYTIHVKIGPAPIEFTANVAAWADAKEANKEMN